jgi:hypothetical protein
MASFGTSLNQEIFYSLKKAQIVIGHPPTLIALDIGRQRRKHAQASGPN